MKTKDKLRVLLLLCFLTLAYLVFFPGVDHEAEIRRKLQQQEQMWEQKRLKTLNFEDVRWDGILRYRNGRYEADENRFMNEEVEIDEPAELPPELEIVEVDHEELREIREAPRKQLDAWSFQGNEHVEVFNTNENQVRFVPDRDNVEAKSLMFKPSGLKYLVELQPMPLFRSDQCPKNFEPDGDNAVFDTLMKCKHQSPYPPDVEQWYYTQVIQCAGHLSIYNRGMAMLQDVILDKGHSAQLTKDVLPNYSDFGNKNYGADTADGMYHFELGFFKIYCPTTFNKLSYAFRGGSRNHLSRWYYVTEEFTNPMGIDNVVTQVTIAMTRYNPDNLYYTLGEAYNAYLAMRFFNLSADNIIVLNVDSYPYTPLDTVWSYLFHMTLNMANIHTRTQFHTMIWNNIGHQSHLLMTNLSSLGYVEEFSKFVLQRFGIMWKKSLDCNKLTVLLILRRNYLDTDGNKGRKVGRKIDNEQQLWFDVVEHFNMDQINGSQLDLLPMKTQLHHISSTDILVGMHGAGLSHALFLPKHAAVLELFPGYWNKPSDQYKAICRWRNLIYESWTNHNPEQESQFKDTVAVDTAAVIEKLTKIKNTMCPLADSKPVVQFKVLNNNVQNDGKNNVNAVKSGRKFRNQLAKRKFKNRPRKASGVDTTNVNAIRDKGIDFNVVRNNWKNLDKVQNKYRPNDISIKNRWNDLNNDKNYLGSN